jgi:hypothetical protein
VIGCTGLSGVAFPPNSAAQFLFDWLVLPSLQTNLAPSQLAIPPFFPEHGWLAALLAIGNSRIAAKIRVKADVLLVRNFIVYPVVGEIFIKQLFLKPVFAYFPTSFQQ